MTRFKNSKLILAFSIIIFLTLLCTISFSIYSIYTNSLEVQNLLERASRADEARILTQRARSVRVQAASDIEAFENIVISEDAVVSFIEKIEGAGEALGIRTKVISVSKKEGDEHLLEMVIEAGGSWAQIFTLLTALESLPYKITADKVSLYKDGTEWKLEFKMLLNYFEKHGQ